MRTLAATTSQTPVGIRSAAGRDGQVRRHGRWRNQLIRAMAVVAGAIGVAATVVVPAGSASSSPSHPRLDLAMSQPVQLAWASLPTPEARGAALAALTLDELRAAGVPEPAIEILDLGGALGQFDSRTWTLRLSLPALAATGTTGASTRSRTIAGVARHEARHAEQWFSMAQLRAAEGRSVAQITTELAVPPAVAAAASTRPLDPSTELAAEARGWLESIYGSGAGRRNEVIATMLAAKSSYDTAVRMYKDAPSPTTGSALTESMKRLELVYQPYRALPEEADAFEIQAAHEADLLARR